MNFEYARSPRASGIAKATSLVLAILLNACSMQVQVVLNPAGEEALSELAAPKSLSYGSASAIYVYNDENPSLSNPILANTPSVSGVVTSYSISPNLNSNTGLSFDPSTGIISGTPTVSSPATSYTVTASGPAGSTTATLSIRTGPGFQVNSTGDADDSSTADNICSTAGGVCTLRAAVTQINAMSSSVHRLIVVPAGSYATGSNITLTNYTEIVGDPAGGSVFTVAGASGDTLVFNNASASVIISNLTFQNAFNAVWIESAASATLNNLTVINMRAAICLEAGAITINQLSMSNSGGNGYGIWAESGVTTLTITNSSLVGNRGTSIEFDGTTLTLTDSLIANGTNNGSFSGVAIDFNSWNSSPTATLQNVTIANNTGFNGPAFTVGGYGIATLINCTIAGNIDTNYVDQNYGMGGPINAGNSYEATGIYLENSLMVGNMALNDSGDEAPDSCDESGQIASIGYNVLDTGDCGFTQTGDQQNISSSSIGLGALAKNGGVTETMAIAMTSAAYRAADPAACPATDQRGYTRDLPSSCDAGAYEANGVAP